MVRKALGILAVVFSSQGALAHGSLIDLSQVAISESLNQFQSAFSAKQIQSYSGVKAWKSSNNIKVRVYFDSSDSVVYECELKHFDDGTEKMVCTSI